jgi:uncharacterized protein (TIGR02996 family)
VDRPGDDLPRLVYADWLDERGDERGAYLRAEAAAPGNAAALTPLATGLDPVWVARVSRPPAGVCCDHVRFIRSGNPLSIDAIHAAEERLEVRFPPQYIAYLLNYNGGYPRSANSSPEAYLYDERASPVQSFSCIHPNAPSVLDLCRFTDWFSATEDEYPSFTRNTLVLARPNSGDDEDDVILLGTTGKQAGRVFRYRDAVHHSDLDDAADFFEEWFPSLGDMLAQIRVERDDG